MNTHTIPITINRVAHTPSQLTQAEQTGFVLDEHLETRRTVKTHAIDNVTPDIISDRDDGIQVELNDTKDGYQVTVTIADVAAHVPLNTPLATVAHERAFTEYRPSGNDPMFPQGLEHRMSLEHDQQRLGLSVIMDLDKHFQLTDTRFEPVIAVPDNVDYAMANQRRTSDPHFKHMNDVAQGIFHYMFSNNMSLLKDTSLLRTMDEPTNDQGLEASLMVASYMLLANHAVASFFEPTGLPFVYRNFDGTHKSPKGDDRAFYDTSFTAHTELEKTGLRGAYCHFTSPIRRGPDFFNGHMTHYVINISHAIIDRMEELSPETPHDSYALWRELPTILHALNHYHQAPNEEAKTQLQHAITHAIQSSTAIDNNPALRDAIMTDIIAMHPPLKADHLKSSVLEINTLNDQERDAAPYNDQSKVEQKLAAHKETIQSYTAQGLAAKDRSSFSSALRHCAKTGDLPDIVYEEARKRLADGNVNKALDAMHVMIEGHQHDDGHWRDLKKAMATSIKEDSSTVNNVLLMAEYYDLLEGQSISLEEISLPLKDNRQKNPESINAAIVKTEPTEQSAPFYSLGHDSRAARTHARYSFLEHYAFNQLTPMKDAAAPDLLYANLTGRNKKRTLKAIVEPRGGTIVTAHREFPKLICKNRDEAHIFTVKVEGGDFNDMITATAYGESEEAAQKKAYRKILRKPELKTKAQSITPELMWKFMNPQPALEELVTEHEGEMSISLKNISKGEANFHATIDLELYGTTYRYEADGINKSRATNAACAAALSQNPHIAITWPKRLERSSWVADAVKPETTQRSR